MTWAMNPVTKRLGAVLAFVSLQIFGGCGDTESNQDSELPQCANPLDETAFFPFYPVGYCRWMEDCSPDTYDELGCAESQINLVYCHEADPCLTEACIVALDRDFEEAPDDCALVPAACDGIFNLDIDRCAE